MNFNLFAPRPATDPKQLTAIKAWAAEVFHVGEDVALMVAELRCAEPGCPPLETVIALLGTPGQPRQFKIHKAIADVTYADVLQLAQGIPPQE